LKTCGISVLVDKHHKTKFSPIATATKSTNQVNPSSKPTPITKEPQLDKFKAVLKLTGKLSQLTNQDITDTLKEGGNKIASNYQIGNNKKSKTIRVEAANPIPTLIKLGKTGTRYSMEPFITKHRFCSNCKQWGHFKSK
jgi:hypothetical protein